MSLDPVPEEPVPDEQSPDERRPDDRGPDDRGPDDGGTEERGPRRRVGLRLVGKVLLIALLSAAAGWAHWHPNGAPADGTLVRSIGPGGRTEVALIVGGAPVPVAAGTAADYPPDQVETIPPERYQSLPTRIADGTFLRADGSDVTWSVYGGHRSIVGTDQLPLREVQVVPVEVLTRIPMTRPSG